MDLVGRLAATVTDLSRVQARVLVGVDGPDAAGKTTLADRLAATLQMQALQVPTSQVPMSPVPALRASIDDFHQPRELRHRRGELSAEGYYRDSFDYPTLLGECLTPFLAGAAQVRIASYNYRADASRPVRVADVP